VTSQMFTFTGRCARWRYMCQRAYKPNRPMCLHGSFCLLRRPSICHIVLMYQTAEKIVKLLPNVWYNLI